jgi:hypothetical protein
MVFGFSFFGYLASRLPRCSPFAMARSSIRQVAASGPADLTTGMIEAAGEGVNQPSAVGTLDAGSQV